MNNERMLNDFTKVSFDPETKEFTITVLPRYGMGTTKIVKLTQEFLNQVCSETRKEDFNSIW